MPIRDGAQSGESMPKSAQQVELGARVELDHALLPPVIGAVPELSRADHEAIVVEEVAGDRQRIGRRARRCRCSSRPGATTAVGSMRVQPLPSSQTSVHACASDCRTIRVAADGIPFAAEIPGDDSRRHSRGAHHHRVRRREVTAESALAVEQRGVHRVDAGGAGIRACIRGRGRGTSRARPRA